MALVERSKEYKTTSLESELLEVIRKELGVYQLSHSDIAYILKSKRFIKLYADAKNGNETAQMEYEYAKKIIIRNMQTDHKFDDTRQQQIDAIGTDQEVETLNDYGPNSLNVMSSEFEKYLARNNTSNTENVRISSILGETSIFQFARTILPISKEAFVRCDLNLKTAIISDDRTEFTWNLNWGPPRLETGYINLNANLGRIARLRIGQTMFSNSTLDTVTTLVANRRIAFDIKEFNDESFIHQNGERFHFLQILGDRYYDKYGNNIRTSSFLLNKGWYRFAKHHMPPSTLTLKFTDLFGPTRISFPATPISIPATQWFQKSVASAFYAISPYDYPLQIDPPYYQLMPIVYRYMDKGVWATAGPGTVRPQFVFSGFTTDDPVTDAALIAAYNGPQDLSKLFDYYFTQSVFIGGATFFAVPPVAIPVTLTFIYAPSFSTSLDIWFDIEPEDKLN